MFEFEDCWDSNPDDDEYYQECINIPSEDEEFCADLFYGQADCDEDCYGVHEFHNLNESDELLLGDDLEEFADYDENLYAVQDFNHLNESDELLLGDDLEEFADYDENLYAVQDLNHLNESDELLLGDDFEELADYDENLYAVQDLNHLNDSDEYFCGDLLEGYADYDEYCYAHQGQQNLNESEEMLCQQLMERLNVETVAKSTARNKPAVKTDPPTSQRRSTSDDPAVGSQRKAELASLNAKSVCIASGETNGNVTENPAVEQYPPTAKYLSIKNGDAETLILQPD